MGENGKSYQFFKLKDYANVGRDEKFFGMMEFLKNLAEEEEWYYDYEKFDEKKKELAVLYQYIYHTFAKAKEDDKIFENEKYSILNTGLLSRNINEIYMIFGKNDKYPDRQPWYLIGFFDSSNRRIPAELLGNLPVHIDYFEEKPEEAYFNIKLPINVDCKHIVEDNAERLPDFMSAFPVETQMEMVRTSVNGMEKRIRRNNRLVVPQYYRGKITYLAPLPLGDKIIPLALEKLGDSYRANTVLTPGMAYCNARLVMRPESNWLSNDKK